MCDQSLVLQLLALLGQQGSQAVEGVFEAGLVDGLQARLAAADARALVLVVAQAHVVLVCLRHSHTHPDVKPPYRTASNSSEE